MNRKEKDKIYEGLMQHDGHSVPLDRSDGFVSVNCRSDYLVLKLHSHDEGTFIRTFKRDGMRDENIFTYEDCRSILVALDKSYERKSSKIKRIKSSVIRAIRKEIES